jgi:RNA polymerase primary sigma factor
MPRRCCCASRSWPNEEAAEEAAAALATTVDAEFGRTTDPVRMYMREMGTVELLTREGEIAIAKRIEEGLDSVRRALAAYPPTCELILRTYEPLKSGQGRLADIIVGFVDPNAPDVIAEPINPKLAAAAKEASEEEEETEGAEDEEAVDTGPDPEEAARRFASLAKLYGQTLKALDPTRAAVIPRRPSCAASSPTSSWSSSSHRGCSSS